MLCLHSSAQRVQFFFFRFVDFGQNCSFDQHSYLNTHRYCCVPTNLRIGFIYGRVELLFDEWYYQCNLSASAKMGKRVEERGFNFRPCDAFLSRLVSKYIGQRICTCSGSRACKQGFHERGKYVEEIQRGGALREATFLRHRFSSMLTIEIPKV